MAALQPVPSEAVTQAETEKMAPLEALRRELHEGLATIVTAARAVETGPGPDAVAALEQARAFAGTTLAKAFQGEEYTLFPAVDGIYGEVGATAVLVAQHRAIDAMVSDLAKLSEDRPAEDLDARREPLIALLWSLYGATRLHLESEDDALLPLIADHLSQSQVEVIVENLGRITGKMAGPPA